MTPRRAKERQHDALLVALDALKGLVHRCEAEEAGTSWAAFEDAKRAIKGANLAVAMTEHYQRESS